MSTVIDFRNAAHYVLVWLMFPGSDRAQMNNYPNCHYSWQGDTLNIIPDGAIFPRASYRRDIVMLAEEHGDDGNVDPAARGQQAAVVRPAIPPARPTAGETQVIPVTSPERMQPVHTSPSQDAVANMQRIVREMNDEAKKPEMTDQEFDAELDRQVGKLRPQTSDRLDFLQPKKENPPTNSPAESISDEPKVSGWHAFLELTGGDNPDPNPEPRKNYQRGTDLARTAGAHRRPSWWKRVAKQTRTRASRAILVPTLALRIYGMPIVAN
jgi:hypothetical protein